MIFLGDVLATLSALRGESSPPASTTAVRTEFINRTLEEIYEAADWSFARVAATVTLVSGLASLPSGLSFEHPFNVQYESTPGNPLTAIEMNEISTNDRYNAADGQNLYWLTTNGDGTYVLNTRDTSPTRIKYTGYAVAPTLAASVGTPFPDRMTVALGANRWVSKAQNPEADISQDEDLYQNRLGDNIGAYNRSTRKRRLRTAQTEAGSATGDF